MTIYTPSSLLIIDPDTAQAQKLLPLFKREGWACAAVENHAAALKALEIDHFAVVLLSLDPNTVTELAFLSELRSLSSPPEVIAVTAQGSINLAIEAMKAGAYDFLMLPASNERLLTTVRNALDRFKLKATVATYQKVDRADFSGFVGAAPAMQVVYRMIESAAGSKATVFVTGESGTGKEVCASAIHQLSPRVRAPFIALNCAAIPKDLIESEVFGHIKGAFTGATADREGAAGQANGGTLFLDEICEMDLNLQSKLLRFLQTGTFQRVGGSKLETVDVRIVCATNRDPLAEVRAGRFREDLYYRLHVIPINLPPLRERGDDILRIAQHFLIQYSKEEGKIFKGYTPAAEQVIRHYDWPGNIRQLQNIVRNIVVMNEGEMVTDTMIPPPVGGRWARPDGFRHASTALMPSFGAQSSSSAVGAGGTILPATLNRADIRPLAEIEREAIEQAITLCGGNVPMAAAHLGVSPSTLYRKRQSWSD